MSLMSLREYARHKGVSLAAVQKAIRSCRIIVAKEEVHGTKTLKFIDSTLADRMWNERTDPVQQRVATRGEMGREEKVKETIPDGEQQSLFSEDSQFTTNSSSNVQSKNSQGNYGDHYNRARAVRETFNAKIAELDYKERNGELANKGEIARLLFNISSGVMQNILNVPHKISSIIHARCISFMIEHKSNPDCILDIKEIEDIITGELKDALEEIANGINLN